MTTRYSAWRSWWPHSPRILLFESVTPLHSPILWDQKVLGSVHRSPPQYTTWSNRVHCSSLPWSNFLTNTCVNISREYAPGCPTRPVRVTLSQVCAWMSHAACQGSSVTSMRLEVPRVLSGSHCHKYAPGCPMRPVRVPLSQDTVPSCIGVHNLWLAHRYISYIVSIWLNWCGLSWRHCWRCFVGPQVQ